MERLRSGTGVSEQDDARQAGAEAAEAAARTLEGAEPLLVMVYASVRYDLPELLAGVRSVTGDVPLAGATSSGHFAGETVVAPGSGVGVMILGGGDYHFGVGSAEGMRADPKAVGAKLTRAAKAAAKSLAGADENAHAAMVLFTDGLVGDQQAVINGVHQVCGAAVPVVGGAAADDMQMKCTSVFHDGEVLTDAAVGIWISSPRPLTVTSAHGWKPVSLPILITRSEGTLIYEIAGRPAGEVFHELASAVSDKPLETDGTMWKASYALGLIEPDGSHLVRGVFTTPDGPISTFTPLPAYSAVQLMTADPGTLLSVVDGVVDETLVYGDETVLLAFDCVGRMDIFGDDYPDEIARINKAARGARCFGSYTYGEFARARGVGGVHNATLTTLAL
jgi:hypothetical protein